MTHLSRERLLEAVESGAWADTADHLASCARCRAEVDALRRTLDEVRAVDVPEPSPLFWDHLTARVRDAIAAEPEPLRVGVRSWWRPAFAAGVVFVAAVLVHLASGSITREATRPPVPTASRMGPRAIRRFLRSGERMLATPIATKLQDRAITALASPASAGFNAQMPCSP